MGWKPLKKLGKFLEKNGGKLLGGVVSGNGGGAVLDILKSSFGIDGDKSEDEMIALIKSHPEYAVKLKEIELNHEVELGKLRLQSEAAYLGDRQSARMREIETVKATGERDWFLYGLAGLYTTGFFTILGILMFVSLPKATTGSLQIMMGALAVGQGAILQYFFGSSKGSADKTRIMANGKK